MVCRCTLTASSGETLVGVTRESFPNYTKRQSSKSRPLGMRGDQQRSCSLESIAVEQMA